MAVSQETPIFAICGGGAFDKLRRSSRFAPNTPMAHGGTGQAWGFRICQFRVGNGVIFFDWRQETGEPFWNAIADFVVICLNSEMWAGRDWRVPWAMHRKSDHKRGFRSSPREVIDDFAGGPNSHIDSLSGPSSRLIAWSRGQLEPTFREMSLNAAILAKRGSYAAVSGLQTLPPTSASRWHLTPGAEGNGRRDQLFCQPSEMSVRSRRFATERSNPAAQERDLAARNSAIAEQARKWRNRECDNESRAREAVSTRGKHGAIRSPKKSDNCGGGATPDFDDFLLRLDDVSSLQALGAAIQTAVLDIGVRTFAYHQIRPRCRSLAQREDPNDRSYYAEGYPDYHFANFGFARRHAMFSVVPVTWELLIKRGRSTTSHKPVLDQLTACGPHSAIPIPIHGPEGSLAAFTFATDIAADPRGDFWLRHRLQLQAMSYHIHETIARVRPDRSTNSSTPMLTDREAECLLWAARGKTKWEVGRILSVSENTVRFHLRNAMQKLGVSSVIHAATMATRSGAINP